MRKRVGVLIFLVILFNLLFLSYVSADNPYELEAGVNYCSAIVGDSCLIDITLENVPEGGLALKSFLFHVYFDVDFLEQPTTADISPSPDLPVAAFAGNTANPGDITFGNNFQSVEGSVPIYDGMILGKINFTTKEDAVTGDSTNLSEITVSGYMIGGPVGDRYEPIEGQEDFLIAGPESSQVIMRLSSTTNAHGEFWNGRGLYPVTIRYDDIFGIKYTGADPYVCKPVPGGNNQVLRLSDTTNAHAAIPHGGGPPPGYFDLCYGDLRCGGTTSNCDKISGEGIPLGSAKFVVALSNMDNAHLSNTSNYYYPIKICCYSNFTAPSVNVTNLTGAYWADMMETPINTAQVDDEVKLMVGGIDIEGKTIEYTIYRDSWWFLPDSKVAQTSTLGYTTWRAGLKDDGTYATGDYYFIAGIEGGGEIDSRHNEDGSDNEYGILHVTSPADNQPPIAVIIKPVDGSKHAVTSTISYEQASIDVDDDLQARWNFGDDTESLWLLNCLTGGNCNITHSYSEQGAYNVRLNVKEMERGQADSDVVEILVYKEGINAFPIITQPENNEFIQGKIVEFDASDSFIAECSGEQNNCVTKATGKGY